MGEPRTVAEELKRLTAELTQARRELALAKARAARQARLAEAGIRSSAAGTVTADALAPGPESPATPQVILVEVASRLPATPVTARDDDLADPKSFRKLPDPQGLLPSGRADPEFRQALMTELQLANSILHTSGVPAPVWRAWREHEKAIRNLLGGA